MVSRREALLCRLQRIECRRHAAAKFSLDERSTGRDRIRDILSGQDLRFHLDQIRERRRLDPL